MNYVIRGIGELKGSLLLGVLIYAVIYGLLWCLKPERRKMTWRNLAELIFCIYGMTLLRLTGIFSLALVESGNYHFNPVPFVGSAILPALLNFLLFLPYGLLLPVVFRRRWNWRRVLAVGLATTFIIELAQMFGGRYAELEDILLNALGAVAGYALYVSVRDFSENRGKSLARLATLILITAIGFGGIYAVGDNEADLPDGLMAVAEDVAEVNVYHGGDKTALDVNSELYTALETQLTNCGGHILQVKPADEAVPDEESYFIEVVYNAPQDISFSNAEGFVISADRLLYNADDNLLYWGVGGYRYMTDYAVFDESLQPHSREILAEYEGLRDSVAAYFR